MNKRGELASVRLRNRVKKTWSSTVTGHLLLGSLLPLTVLVLWHLCSAHETTVIPTIKEVFDVIIHPFQNPPHLDSKPLFQTVYISVLRVAIGFFAATITAVPLGLLIGRSKIADKLISPSIEMLRPICPIAWIPLAIIFFGFSSFGTAIWGQQSWQHDTLDQLKFAMVFVIWWGAFFPILLNSIAGSRGVKKLYIDSAKVLGVSGSKMFFFVIFPASLPRILIGLRVGMGIAWMVIVAAEFFPGTNTGLGYMIATSHQVSAYEYTFAAIICIGGLGLLMNKGMEFISAKINKWESLER